MQLQQQPSWVFCMVAALKGVQVLEAMLEWQEAQYLEGLEVQGWEESAFLMQWLHIEIE